MASREFPKKSGLEALLCPHALGATPGDSLPSVQAREDIKELIGLTPNISAPTENSKDTRWKHLLEILVQDFLVRKHEVSRLDKGRRERIERELQGTSNVPLAQFLESKVGTSENLALLRFSHELAFFHLLQILLVKRLSDLKLLKSAGSSQATPNWLLTHYIKSRTSRPIQGRSEWAFLKQNLFSWFSPSSDTWERIRLALGNLPLEETPLSILEAIEDSSPIGIACENGDSLPLNSAWEILIRARCHDTGESVISQEPVLAFGTGAARAALGLKMVSPNTPLWLAPSSELEQFLAEITLLWTAPGQLPPVRTISPICWKSAAPSALFQSALTPDERCQLVFCSPSPTRPLSLDCLDKILGVTLEGGLLLWSGKSYWPTETDERSQILRDTILRECRIRMLIDLRNLHGANLETPKSLSLLEKCSSKEIRDSHRPVLLRVRGSVRTAAELESLWQFLSRICSVETLPGEVQQLSIPGTQLRIEVMAAAANQSQLRGVAWTSLAEPEFFHAVGVLKRSPERAYLCGHVLARKQVADPTFTPAKSLALKKVEGSRFLAESAKDRPEKVEYLFVPDASLPESPLYLSALFNSSPVQFWFRLEQEAEISLGRSRSQKRQLEQLFKLIPVVRVLPRGVPLPAETPRKLSLQTIGEARTKFLRLLSAPGEWSTADRVWLHDFAVQMEVTSQHQLDTARSCLSHLHPQLRLERWSIPRKLPTVDPVHALNLLQHHSRAPVLAHPLLHTTRLKAVSDFKVTRAEERPQLSGMSEVVLYSGLEAQLRISGPTFLTKAVATECGRRSGRPWLDIGSKLLLPTDIGPVLNQLSEFERITLQEISRLREHLGVLDELFCGLFGLDLKSDLEMIRRHLEPEEIRVVDLVRPVQNWLSPAKDAASPTALLQ